MTAGAPARSFNRALAAVMAAGVVFLSCVFASALFHWHSEVTGAGAALSGVGLLACGAWLNRAAGKTGGEEQE